MISIDSIAVDTTGWKHFESTPEQKVWLNHQYRESLSIHYFPNRPDLPVDLAQPDALAVLGDRVWGLARTQDGSLWAAGLRGLVRAAGFLRAGADDPSAGTKLRYRLDSRLKNPWVWNDSRNRNRPKSRW